MGVTQKYQLRISLNFKRNYDVLKSKNFKVHAFCWTKIKTLIKTKQNQEWKILHTVWERRTLCFSWHRSCKFKVKLWWFGGCERKKRTFFVPFILSKENFFNICVLSHLTTLCISYTFLPVFLKPLKAFSVSSIRRLHEYKKYFYFKNNK